MRRSVVVAVVAVLVSLVAPPVPAVTRGAGWTVAFDGEVTGNVVTAGNAVTRGPPAPDAAACRDAETGVANGVLNNDYPMVWSDTDDDPRTETSSSALLDVPAGARIAHATLAWAGVLRDGSTGLCGRTATWSSGSPRSVTFAVAGRNGPRRSPRRRSRRGPFRAVRTAGTARGWT